MNGHNGNQYFGKHRGTVLNNIDPLNEGRLLVQVPDVLGLTTSSWAMPCVPATGKEMGVWVLPQISAGVWVEFEQGDPDYPIWTGCFWGSGVEPPKLALQAIPGIPSFVMQTMAQHKFMLSDVPGKTGGILLETPTKAFISITDIGITISNGKGSKIELMGPNIEITNGSATIKMTGPDITIDNKAAEVVIKGPKVSINKGALEVT